MLTKEKVSGQYHLGVLIANPAFYKSSDIWDTPDDGDTIRRTCPLINLQIQQILTLM